MFARSGAAQLAYDVTGGPGGPPVLLLHAGVTDRRSFAALRAALDVTTIAFDRRGFGETTYEPEPYSHVDDALAVLAAAGVDEPVVLVGASMGGRVALDMALAHPERVSALVLIGSAVRGEPQTGYPEPTADEQRLEDAVDAAGEADDLDAVNRIEAHYWLDGPERARGPRRRRDARAVPRDERHRAGGRRAPARSIELPSALERLERDRRADARARRAISTRGPRSGSAHSLPSASPVRASRLLEGTGHLPHFEGHARCLEAIARVPQAVTTVPRQRIRSWCGARTTRSTATFAVQPPTTISRASAATTTGAENDVPLHRAQPRKRSGSTVLISGVRPLKSAKNDETSPAPGAQASTQLP